MKIFFVIPIMIMMLFISLLHNSISADTNSPYKSPLQQIKNGILPENIICKDGFITIFKSSNHSPACVRPDSAMILTKGSRWIIPPTKPSLNQPIEHVQNNPKNIEGNSNNKSAYSNTISSINSSFVTKISISKIPKLGETTQLTVQGQYISASTWPADRLMNVTALFAIPEGFELVSDGFSILTELDYIGHHYVAHSKSFNGSLTEPFEITATIRAVHTGNWTILGEVDDGAAYMYLSIGEDASYVSETQFPLPTSKPGTGEFYGTPMVCEVLDPQNESPENARLTQLFSQPVNLDPKTVEAISNTGPSNKTVSFVDGSEIGMNLTYPEQLKLGKLSQLKLSIFDKNTSKNRIIENKWYIELPNVFDLINGTLSGDTKINKTNPHTSSVSIKPTKVGNWTITTKFGCVTKNWSMIVINE